MNIGWAALAIFRSGGRKSGVPRLEVCDILVRQGVGTAAQKKYGIKDSPDQLFQDLTDWSVVETSKMHGFPLTTSSNPIIFTASANI